MAKTQVRGSQVLDGSIQRDDQDAATSGQAVIRKLIQGSGISLSSTGADSGTGDVTVNADIVLGGTLYVVTGGNDATGARGNIDRPYATVSGANADASAGDFIFVGPGVFTENSGFTLTAGVSLIGRGIGVTKITSNLNVASNAVLRPGNNCFVADLTVECTGASSSPIGISSGDTVSTGTIFSRVKTIGVIDGFKVEKTGTSSFQAFDCISVAGTAGGTVDCVFIGLGTATLEFWNCDFTATGSGTTFASARVVRAVTGEIRLWNCKLQSGGAGSSGDNIGISVAGGVVEAHNVRIKTDGSGGATVGDLVRTSGTLKFDNITKDDGSALILSGLMTRLQRKRILSISAPGATPTVNTDVAEVVHLTGIAAAITSMTTNLSGAPVEGDTLRIDFTDNGTARAITWGSSFEASGNVTLPTTTVISIRLDTGFFWNTATSKWRIVAKA